jgi:UrcA family protein
VRYTDLDLTKTAGREVLEQRLDRAVRNVCGERPTRNLPLMIGYKACITKARASYQNQVELALNNANARRVAVLADKLGMLAGF